jgi:hypothetical protein
MAKAWRLIFIHRWFGMKSSLLVLALLALLCCSCQQTERDIDCFSFTDSLFGGQWMNYYERRPELPGYMSGVCLDSSHAVLLAQGNYALAFGHFKKKMFVQDSVIYPFNDFQKNPKKEAKFFEYAGYESDLSAIICQSNDKFLIVNQNMIYHIDLAKKRIEKEKYLALRYSWDGARIQNIQCDSGKIQLSYFAPKGDSSSRNKYVINDHFLVLMSESLCFRYILATDTSWFGECSAFRNPPPRSTLSTEEVWYLSGKLKVSLDSLVRKEKDFRKKYRRHSGGSE